MEFNEREQALIALLADLSDKRSKEEKALAAGYSAKHVYRLQEKPAFRAAVIQLIKDNLGLDIVRVIDMLINRAVFKEDVKAAELLLKAGGYIQTGARQANVTNVRTGGVDEDGRTFAERIEDWRNDRRKTYAERIEELTKDGDSRYRERRGIEEGEDDGRKE